MELMVNGNSVVLNNLDKLYFAEKNLKKGDIIDYYLRISPYLLPHLKNRPISMIIFPSASVEKSFYQKQAPKDIPSFVSTVNVASKKRGSIDYVMVNNKETLAYLVGRGMLEAHAWFSRSDKLEYPDLAVIDLDPSGSAGFSQCVEVARIFHGVLEQLELFSAPKTSGSSGLHIFIPIKRVYQFSEVQTFLQAICREVARIAPELCTLERTIANRGNRVYLDAVQCNWGKTLAMPYSLRVKSQALVSTPLRWSEVNSTLNPADFDAFTIFSRLEEVGDLWADLYDRSQNLPFLY